jgi:hypothetical protein
MGRISLGALLLVTSGRVRFSNDWDASNSFSISACVCGSPCPPKHVTTRREYGCKRDTHCSKWLSLLEMNSSICCTVLSNLHVRNPPSRQPSSKRRWWCTYVQRGPRLHSPGSCGGEIHHFHRRLEHARLQLQHPWREGRSQCRPSVGVAACRVNGALGWPKRRHGEGHVPLGKVWIYEVLGWLYARVEAVSTRFRPASGKEPG